MSQYEVSRLGHGLRVPFDQYGLAELPWPEDARPDLTVRAPGRLEVSALFNDSIAIEDAVPIRVAGGEALDVHLVGEIHDSRMLVLSLQFDSVLGYTAFVTVPTAIGNTESFELCEPGTAWLDLGVKCEDRTILVLGRARAEIVAGRSTAITVDVGQQRTVARFEAGSRQIVEQGSLFFTSEGETELSPTGGTLDENGCLVIPTQVEREFYVIGHTGPADDPVVAADIPVVIDTRAGRDVLVPLGEAIRSEVELVNANSGAPLTDWRFDIVGGKTRQFCAQASTGSDGGPAKVNWHAFGTPCFEILWNGIWSPREPVPLIQGHQRIAVTLRAECTFHVAGATIDDVRHIPTGLDDAALRSDQGVSVEEVFGGRRYSGIPAGGYLVRLAGEETWRGPFEVRAGVPCDVTVPAD